VAAVSHDSAKVLKFAKKGKSRLSRLSVLTPPRLTNSRLTLQAAD